jgi:hypothetical protein
VTAESGYSFPDWRRILPQRASGEVSQFNAHYLADFAKAADFLTDRKAGISRVFVRYNGDASSLIDLGLDDAIAVLMPMRGEPAPFGYPSWLNGPPADQAVAA